MFLDCVLVGCAVEWFILLLVKSEFVFEFGFLVYFLFYSAKQNNGFVFPFYVFDFKQKKQETHVSVISFIDLNRKSIETKVLGPPPPCIPVALCLICASQSGALHNASYTGPMLVYCGVVSVTPSNKVLTVQFPGCAGVAHHHVRQAA